MKLRTLMPAVLAAFSTTAFAANVELYGIVDAYVQVYNGGNGAVVDLGSGGKAGSRWGIKGTENLGGGNSVFFRLENGFMLDNGTNSPATGGDGYAFQRETVLGVKGGWGALSFGRQYTLNFGGIAQFDAFGCSLGSTINNFMAPAPYIPSNHVSGINGLSGIDNMTRRDNSIIYESPKFGGLVMSAMVSLGEQKKLNRVTQELSDEQSNKLGNTYAVQAVYRSGALGVGLTYTYQNLAGFAPNNFRTINAHESLYNLGASYDFGVTKLYGNLIYRQGSKAVDRNANPNLMVYSVSAKTPLMGGYLLNGFAFLKNNTTDDSNAWNISARYDYPLSKRSTIYGGAAYMHNDDNVNYTINGGGGSSSAPDTKIGKSPWTVFVGLSHAF
ncbi:porin [uncultured Parasutterella sp.]|uniref:porin n=1 Tax=uncultured Parasutterella sp. TaxID=1263098 RepID=UPI002597F803|nr:porin [uncultured Parasutterella sp.]